jgi:prolyl oligopeptidase
VINWLGKILCRDTFRSMKAWILFFYAGCLAPLSCTLAEDGPPKAAVHEVEDEYWGVKITDPYRWMENVAQDAEAQSWLKAQSDFTRKTLDALPGYVKLQARISELVNSEPATITRPHMLANGNLFYMKTIAGQNTAKLYFRKAASADEVLLVDPDAFGKQDGKPRAINFYEPSWDGSHVAFGISTQGSEDASIRIVETATGEESNEVIPRCEGSVVSWLPDGRHFVYTQLQKLEKGQSESEKYLNSKTRFHELGSDPERDEVYLASGANPTVQFTPQQAAAILLVPGCDFCFATVNNFVANEQKLYAAPLNDLGPNTKWTQLCDLDDQVTGFGLFGSDFYFLTHKDAPKFKIVVRNFRDGKLGSAEEVVPESDKVIQEIISARDGVYYTASDGVDCRLYKVGKAEPHTSVEISLPYEGWPSFYGIEEQIVGNLQTPGLLVNLTSWTRAASYYKYDPDQETMVALNLQPEGPYDHPADLVSEELKVKSHDGTLVPLSVRGLKTFKKDGTHPLWLQGYGSYGIVDEPYFSPSMLAAFEHGMWQAVAHVRGGGVGGDAWHRAGMKTTKPNTWKDFISCGEYLVQNGYSARDKLAGLGGSAGGILIGRAVTERPDLFAVACPVVGALDALRSELTPNGPPNIPEFGTVKIKTEFEALREMSTYEHIVPGTKYPALLFYHGYNDPRVPVWMSAKAAARFQADTTSGKPVLLDIDYESGHGIGNTRAQQIRRLTDLLAFMLWQVDDPEFQPVKAKS